LQLIIDLLAFYGINTVQKTKPSFHASMAFEAMLFPIGVKTTSKKKQKS
jgi:hypothetical protein